MPKINLKNMKKALILLWSFALACPAFASNDGNDEEEREDKVNYMPQIHGTVRAKYEYEPDIDASRFQVRNARVSLEGNVIKAVGYKAEIDLSDEGNIKMLDAYAKITPFDNFDFTIGQMRVPFTIDAHRSPHKQFFANRSFIAKQVGNVRDVGATLGYKVDCKVPIIIQAGLFNGSGLTDQKDYWTDEINYSAKVQFLFPKGVTTVLSLQKIKPEDVAINMYDIGLTWQRRRWTVEGEYLYKHYKHDAFDDVNAVDAFACYDLPLSKVFSKISFLMRYDYMDDHSDGEADEETGLLVVDDPQRHRLTWGITLSLHKMFTSDIRINYEKYIYDDDVEPAVSEQDKFVIEFMIHF